MSFFVLISRMRSSQKEGILSKRRSRERISPCMEGDEIDRYFQALDEELAERTLKKPVRLVVLGGVYMMFFLKNRSSTKDVDVVPLDFPDTMNPNQETKIF